MRYKFKAWDKHKKIWRDRVLAGCDSDGLDYVCNLVWMDDTRDWTHFDEGCGAIVQFTGMKDQNGIEIYEGDILHFTEFDYNGSDTQFTGVVKFANGMWQIWDSWEDEFWGSDGAFNMFGIHQQDDGIEIIGNIYENPDLLTVQTMSRKTGGVTE